MWAGAILFLLCLSLQAKDPITPAVVGANRPAAMPYIVWSPKGDKFVWREGETLRLYDMASARESELFNWKTMEARATAGEKAKAYAWVNRGVMEKPIQWLPSGDALLLAAGGDLFLYQLGSTAPDQITKTAQAETDPKLSPDGKRVAYQAQHDLWVLDLATRKITRLTTGGSAVQRNAELDWVYPEELQLPTAYWWSPDGKHLAYLHFDLSNVMSYPHADLTGLRPTAEPEWFPQAGTPNPHVRLGVVSSNGGRTKWLAEAGPDDLLARVEWLPSSESLATIRLNRVQNHLGLEVIELSGKKRVALEERDPEWVNLTDNYAFLKSGGMLWTSERSGFQHLFRSANIGPDLRPITSGEWLVTSVACVDEAHRRVFYVATNPSPRERQLWVSSFDGGQPTRLTSEPGTHSVNFSPGCDAYLDIHSSLKQPPQATLHSADGKLKATLRPRKTDILDKYTYLDSEFVQVKGKDGARFDARLIRPANFDPSKKYPAIVMVYGGPHAQMVVDRWSGLSWEQVLAQRGFVVWMMDNRGSAYRGHAWESKVFRRFGKQELADQLDGVNYLTSLGFVDPARIGVYGWSFGGFMTLNAMFNAPKVFSAGIAGAPVTDWRQYDTIYTERYMGLPSQNEEGYKASSPVHQAANLQGRLMLVHNFEDDNVLFQHTLRMIDALQQAGKQFDLMLYPQKTHHVAGKVNVQMLEGMTAFFERHLKP